MSADLMPFDYEGQTIRTSTVDGDPVLVGKDVCEAIGIAKYRDALAQLDDDERVSVAVDTPGGPQQMVAITEAGLYALMMISRSPAVKPFRRWVTHEVLPQIRQTGSYVPAQRQLPSKRELAQMVIEAEDRAEQLAAELAETKPAAECWNTLADAHGDHSLREAAQILDRDDYITIGQNRLAKYLAKIGWVDRRGQPYQRHVDIGRLVVRTRVYDHPHTGEPQLTTQIRITPKGLAELHKLLRQDRGDAGVLSLIDGAS